jgi:hypothetical protein
VLTGNVLDDLDDFRRLNPIEFGPELEGRKRIEERVLGDLALRKARRCVEQTKRDPRKPQKAVAHLCEVREATTQSEQAAFGRVLGGVLA